jgi:hypothetical protein
MAPLQGWFTYSQDDNSHRRGLHKHISLVGVNTRYQLQAMSPLSNINQLKLPAKTIMEDKTPCNINAFIGVRYLGCNSPNVDGRYLSCPAT